MTKILAGNHFKELAKALSKQLSLKYLDASIVRFADEEFRVQIPQPLYEEDVVIVQSTCKPANDHLMELLLLVDAARRSGASRIIVVAPYFGYSRQDRPSYEGGPISSRLVASLLEVAGVDYLVTLDLHSKQSEGFFTINVLNVDPLPLFLPSIDKSKDLIVVSPDIGGLIRARVLAKALKAGIAIINKTRIEYNTCVVTNIIGDVRKKHCLMIDDIVDTGGTICKAAVLLKESGALSIEVLVTHPVLSNVAVQHLNKAPIEKIITTNSIPQERLPKKFKVLDITSIIKATLKNILIKPDRCTR